MDAWFGIAAILVGLASCFYGYPLCRILLILAGLIEGYVLGQSFVPAGYPWAIPGDRHRANFFPQITLSGQGGTQSIDLARLFSGPFSACYSGSINISSLGKKIFLTVPRT